MKKKTILAFFCFHWIFKYLEIKTNLTIFIDQRVITSLTFHNLSDLLTVHFEGYLLGPFFTFFYITSPSSLITLFMMFITGHSLAVSVD